MNHYHSADRREYTQQEIDEMAYRVHATLKEEGSCTLWFLIQTHGYVYWRLILLAVHDLIYSSHLKHLRIKGIDPYDNKAPELTDHILRL
jgi:hypothetical protein